MTCVSRSFFDSLSLSSLVSGAAPSPQPAPQTPRQNPPPAAGAVVRSLWSLHFGGLLWGAAFRLSPRSAPGARASLLALPPPPALAPAHGGRPSGRLLCESVTSSRWSWLRFARPPGNCARPFASVERPPRFAFRRTPAAGRRSQCVHLPSRRARCHPPAGGRPRGRVVCLRLWLVCRPASSVAALQGHRPARLRPSGCRLRLAGALAASPCGVRGWFSPRTPLLSPARSAGSVPPGRYPSLRVLQSASAFAM